MKPVRFIVTQNCNLSCPYCCNELPEVRARFQHCNDFDVPDIIREHGNVSITGGEPLLDSAIDYTEDLCILAKHLGKKAYLYTNGIRLMQGHGHVVARMFDGVNIGIHVGSGFDPKALQYVCHQVLGDKARFHIQEGYEHLLIPEATNFKVWKMNECETEEDIFVVRGIGR